MTNVLILLFYYDRPDMVKRFALNSVFSSTCKNFEVRLVDDSTQQNANVVVDEFFESNPQFAKYKSALHIHQTNDTLEKKIARGTPETEGGSIFGKYAQEALEQSEGDLCVMLCDDDALLPDYTLNLSLFYDRNPDINYSYSQVILFNPARDRSLSDAQYKPCNLNNTECLPPPTRVDSSQVSWRRTAFIDADIQFPYPRTRSIDMILYRQMLTAWGDCCWNGLCGQYKGRFSDQLGGRGNTDHMDEWYNVAYK